MFNKSGPYIRRGIVGLIIAIIITAAGIGAWLNASSTDRSIRGQLENRTASIAQLLRPDDIQRLTGTSKDLQTGYYQDIKRTLAGLKKANPDFRSLYITVERADGLYFYVDSEQPGSSYYSPPGELYPDATPLFKSLFKSGETAVEGPTKDDFGSWVSGLAPIRDKGNSSVIAVLGVDIDSNYYYQSIIQAAIVPVLLGMMALSVVVISEIIRSRHERLLKLQSELVSIASHELRSPLSGVRWATESLISQLEGNNKVMAERILTSATKLQASIEEILQISRATGPESRSKMQLADCDLTRLITEVCDSQRLSAEQRGVHIIMDSSWSQAVNLRCDADRMRRALHNVVSNAVKYTRDNTDVCVSYHLNGDDHQIQVTDQGIGIPDDEKQKVFQGFYRASNAQASKIQGTGLGLYLTRTVIEQHHGKVAIDSKQDVGTTVTLTLPS